MKEFITTLILAISTCCLYADTTLNADGYWVFDKEKTEKEHGVLPGNYEWFEDRIFLVSKNTILVITEKNQDLKGTG